MVQEQKAIVHGIVPKLGANITNVYILQWLVGPKVSDLDYEGMRAIRFSVNDQLGHYNGVICCTAQRTDPPLRGC